jgi:hypothetical protein
MVCVLLDARAGLDEEAETIFAKLESVKHPKFLVINKIDLVAREKLLALAQKANERIKFQQTFMIAALSGDGVDDLRRALAEVMPAGPYHYPEDQMSDAPLRHLAAEITREKIYRNLHQELPYQSTVETDSWKEVKDKAVRIEQTIFVERDSQRKIVLGKGGATIKAIGAAPPSRRSVRMPARRSPIFWDRKCTCFCSSRYATIGAMIPSAIGKWDWSFRRNERLRACRTGKRAAFRNLSLCFAAHGYAFVFPASDSRRRAAHRRGDLRDFQREPDSAVLLSSLARRASAAQLGALAADGVARPVDPYARERSAP